MRVVPHPVGPGRHIPLLAEFVHGRLESVAELAQLLEHLRGRDSALVALTDALFASLGYSAQHSWRRAAVALANLAMFDDEERCAYHNHRHTLEVTACFWHLASSGADGLGRTDIALGLLAAVAHDLDYATGITEPAGAEAHSAFRAEQILAAQMETPACDCLVKLILATDPACYDLIRANYRELGTPREDSSADRWVRLAALLVRADLAPSTALHERYNYTMSHLLCVETGLEVFDELGPRQAFVLTHTPFTRSETARGFDDANAWIAADLQRSLRARRACGPKR